MKIELNNGGYIYQSPYRRCRNCKKKRYKYTIFTHGYCDVCAKKEKRLAAICNAAR